MTADANFCPYVGLQPFTEEDRAYFFGREREIRLVGANLYAAKLTVLYGESGVGKSSVLMAGVVPKLRLRQKPRTAVVIFRDWQRPDALSILKAAIAHAGDEAAGKPLGLDAGTPLDDLLAAAGKAIGGTTLVLMDQFEEYFLYYPPGGAGDEFDAELARAVNRRDVNAGFVLSIREDSLSKLDRFRARIPTVLANPLRIRHLRPSDARDAIRKPLEVYNQRPDASAKPASIEPALVDALIEQTISGRVSLAQTGATTDTKAEGDERVEAPYLQLVLTRLWNEEGRLGSRVLRLATLEALGGASRIVRTHLDQVMSRLSQDDQVLCADFFDRLVTPSGTKIACRLDDLKQWAGVGRASNVERVVKALAAPEARILRAIDPLPGQPPQYEIFHDVLAAGVLDWRSRFVEAQRLEEAQAEAQHQREEAERERERAEAARRTARRLWVFSAVVALLFVFALGAGWLAYKKQQEATAATHEAQERAEEARIAKDLAEKKAREAAEQRSAADTSRWQAEQAAIDANMSRGQAEEAAIEANTARGEAQRQAAIATARRLATEALNRFALSADGLAVSGILAIESLKSDSTSEGRKALAQVLRLIPPAPEILPETHQGDVRGLAFSRDGRWMASAGFEDHTVILWDMSNQQQKTAIETQFHSAPVGLALSFSYDGRWLAGGGMGALWIWNTKTGTQVQEPVPHDGFVRSVAFSPDGLHLATATRESNVVRLFDRVGDKWVEGRPYVAGDSPRFLGDASPNVVNSVAFPTADRLALAGTYGLSDQHSVWFLKLVDRKEEFLEIRNYKGVQTDRPGKCRSLTLSQDSHALAALCDLAVLTAKKEEVGFYVSDHPQMESGAFSASWGISMNHDGNYVAVLDNGGSIYVYGNPIEEASSVMRVPSVGAQSVAYRPDGKVLAAGFSDGSIAFWPTDKGGGSIKLGYEGRVDRLVFSRDGSWLVTLGNDETVRVFDVADKTDAGTFRQLQSFRIGPDLRSSIFSPDGRFLAVLGKSTVHVLQTKPWKMLARYDVSGDDVEIAFSADSRLVFALEPGLIRRFDTATWREKPAIKVGSTDYGLRVSPDGQFLATLERARSQAQAQSRRGRLYIDLSQIWRLDSGIEVAWREKGRDGSDGPGSRPPQGGPQNLVDESAKWISLKTAGRPTDKGVLSPDGEWSAELQGSTLVLREARSKRDVARLEHDGGVIDVAFSPGGRWLATSSKDRTIRLWPLQVKDMITQACKLMPRNLTPDEWKELNMAGPYRKTCPTRP